MSPAAEYAEEAAFYRKTLNDAARHPIETILELGSGGGNNASHMKRHFKEMVLVDVSPGMLAMSRALNPELEHHEGDMRTVRLGRQFDAVFVHDAVCYMTTESDLRKAIETAFVHCKPGGVALFCPDYISRELRGWHRTRRRGRRDARNAMAIVAVAARSATTRRISWTMPICFARATARCTSNTIATSKDCFRATSGCSCSRMSGFEPITVLPFEHSDLEPGKHEVFVCVKPKTGALEAGASHGKLPEDEALQIVRLRHPEHDRVIPALHPLLDDADVHAARRAPRRGSLPRTSPSLT